MVQVFVVLVADYVGSARAAGASRAQWRSFTLEG